MSGKMFLTTISMFSSDRIKSNTQEAVNDQYDEAEYPISWNPLEGDQPRASGIVGGKKPVPPREGNFLEKTTKTN